MSFNILFLSLPLISKDTNKILNTMAVTTLKRKLKRKRQAQNTRTLKIKQLNAKPVIKNVDVEEIKKEFAKK
jgi:hypothetical protein